MGEARQTRGVSDAAGGRPVGGLAARSALNRFWRCERGATAVELGVMVALICVAIISAVTALTSGITTSFGKAEAAMTAAGS